MTAPFTVIIPSRHGSTRLPGKALIPIQGRPLVQHAWEAARASGARRVIVATDHESILAACRAFGAECVMTSGHHESGTDRIAEVADQLGLDDQAVVVNVQGDQRELPPELIDQVAAMLTGYPDRDMATVCEPFRSVDEARNPSKVKVKFDTDGRALSFSREYTPEPGAMPPWGYRHVGLYAYRAGFLRRFTRLPPGPSEIRERLEQLRALDNGCPIYVAVACAPAGSEVDTPDDLERAATGAVAVDPISRGR